MMATANMATFVTGCSTDNKASSDFLRSSVRDSVLCQNNFRVSETLFLASSALPGRSRSLYPVRASKRHLRFKVSCSTASEPRASVLRDILASPGLHQGPACYDALSAKLVENAGFTFTFMSGFSVAASRLALPDTGLISYGEMVDQGIHITSAVSIPVIGDGDNGYGNALNVKRTVRGYINAGFAGILLEDQVSPKACGHTRGRKVVSREEAVMRIKAAVDARKESLSDIIIVGRTDARQAISLEEALWRAEAMADAGADVIFVDALSSKDEMRALCNTAKMIPKMANMLEGGGKTPILTPMELEELGFKIVSYPLSLIGVSISAMQDALVALKSGRMPPPASLPSFEDIKKVVGFDDYYEEESRYSISSSSSGSNLKAEQIKEMDTNVQSEGFLPASLSSVSTINKDSSSGDNSEEDVIVPYVLEESEDDSQTVSQSKIWSRVLRVKVTGTNGIVKLDVRIPAGFLDGLAKIVPGVAGVNLAALLDESSYTFQDDLESGKELLDINDGRGDRIQIFLE